MDPETTVPSTETQPTKREIVTDTAFLTVPSKDVQSWQEGMDVAGELFSVLHTLGQDKALGLAAPQIGVHKRVFIVYGSTGASHEEGWNIYINPRIELFQSENKLRYEEGCLSLPGVRVTTNRHDEIMVSTLESDGKYHTYAISGRDAIVFQHELDHLDGILMTQRAMKMGENLTRPVKRGRNEPCWCGSGKKFKLCHGR